MSTADASPNADSRFYETKVLPILRAHCFQCHSHAGDMARGGLVLDSRTAVLTGGNTGPAVDPKNVEKSLLIRAVLYDSDERQMPPDGKISDVEIEVLREWVRRGVPGPASSSSSPKSKPQPSADIGEHWAFQPLRESSLPEMADGAASIDDLVEQARRAAGVKAVDEASKDRIVRRLFLDLIGLPPTPRELDELVRGDESPTIESIVDSLLAMPEFGERWGRHWLDVARYADSNGCSIESNNTYDNAWRYRDYVISSLNADKPYDRFVVEQIAGDLLDYVSTTERCEQLIATGFLLLGPKAFGTGSFEQLRLDVIDEQIDTVGKAMIGMSFGCARCHDHKFDPISTQDYYGLAGIFASTQSVRRAKGWRQGRSWHRVELPVLDSAAKTALRKAHQQIKEDAESGALKEQADKSLAKAEAALRELRASETAGSDAIKLAEEAVETARRNVKNAQNMAKVLPVISPVPAAMAVSEKDEPVNEAVRVGGALNNLAELVPRRVLPLFGSRTEEPFSIPENESGRLQLARWLVDVDHGAGSLLARVAVNRIWGHLFARPLVASPDNFGVTGDVPSHPKLLDYLATRFIDSGWSVKSLIRDIVLTRTYQLAAIEDADNSAIDPANRWLWRYQPRRIDIEVLRDSILAMNGSLDRSRGGKTLQHLGLVTLLADHLLLDAPSPFLRRSVYVPIYRDAIGLTSEIDASVGMLGAFDFANPNLMAGLRSQTVVPAQALFLMNAPFVYDQSQVLAKKLLNRPEWTSDTQRIEHLYELVYGRTPSREETDQLLEYIGAFSAGENSGEKQLDRDATRQLAWTSLCQSMLGSNEFLFQD